MRTISVALVVAEYTRITCTGRIDPAARFVKVTSVPCAVSTRIVPPEPQNSTEGLKIVVSLFVTVAASPGNMGNVGEKLVWAIRHSTPP